MKQVWIFLAAFMIAGCPLQQNLGDDPLAARTSLDGSASDLPTDRPVASDDRVSPPLDVLSTLDGDATLDRAGDTATDTESTDASTGADTASLDSAVPDVGLPGDVAGESAAPDAPSGSATFEEVARLLNTHIVVRVSTGGPIDLARVLAAPSTFRAARMVGRFIVWNDVRAAYPWLHEEGQPDPGLPASATPTIVMDANGDLYLGVTGSERDELAGLVPAYGGNEDMVPYVGPYFGLDLRTLGHGAALSFRHRLLQSVGATTRTVVQVVREGRWAVYNGFTKPVFVVRATLMLGDGAASEARHQHACQLWCATPDYRDAGESRRSFELGYTNVTASAAFVSSDTDNGNVSRVSFDGAMIYEQVDWGYRVYRSVGVMPRTVELSNRKTWSGAWPRVSLAFLADNVTIPNWNEWNASTMNPPDSLAQNPMPWVLRIPPGVSTLEELDRDGDGVPNESDNCRDLPNTNQHDRDRDRIGDACDS